MRRYTVDFFAKDRVVVGAVKNEFPREIADVVEAAVASTMSFTSTQPLTPLLDAGGRVSEPDSDRKVNVFSLI